VKGYAAVVNLFFRESSRLFDFFGYIGGGKSAHYRSRQSAIRCMAYCIDQVVAFVQLVFPFYIRLGGLNG